MDETEKKKATAKMAAVGIFGNVFLAVFKTFAGVSGHSAAMISDAVHTLSDIFATIIAFVGVSLSRKEADKEHPYGHERLECVASIILSVILFGTGLSIGVSCARSIWYKTYLDGELPGLIALIAAIVSIAVKEAMFWFTMYYAKRCKSSAFKADAWHHRSDAISSVGALIGIIGARRGFPILDQVAGIAICLMILKVAIDIFKDAVDKMLDSSCDEEFENSIIAYVEEFSKREGQEIGIDMLRTRKFGERIYVDIEINADGNMTLNQSHGIAERLHDALESDFSDIKHVMVHVNPAGYHHDTRDML